MFRASDGAQSIDFRRPKIYFGQECAHIGGFFEIHKEHWFGRMHRTHEKQNQDYGSTTGGKAQDQAPVARA